MPFSGFLLDRLFSRRTGPVGGGPALYHSKAKNNELLKIYRKYLKIVIIYTLQIAKIC